MTWIKIIRPNDPDEPSADAVRDAMMSQRSLYPAAYAGSTESAKRLPPAVMADSIVLSHSLIPDALRHSFSAFGAMMNPELPLTRREHEMIAATVSSVNRCFY